MTDRLPPNLLALFAPRPKLPYLPPPDQAPAKRRTAYISGVADFLPQLAEYQSTDVYHPTESHQQRKERIKQEKTEKADLLAASGAQLFDPKTDPKIQGDPLKTLFVGRLSYAVTEKDLEQEFSRFGPITKIRLVMNDHVSEDAPISKRHKGYAFIEFDRAKDMTAAYKDTENMRLKGRAVVVDVERGRTVTNWRPMRLGGGMGGRHYTKMGSRPSAPGGYGPPSGPGSFRGGFGGRPGGGFRGDFRGDFRGGRGGGFRGPPSSGYGGRGGVGYQSNGFSGAPPDGAPQGPRGGRPNGGGYSGRYDDRHGSGSNREPVGARGGGGGYRDYDREGGRDDSRKRRHEGDSYDDRRSKPRY